METIKSVKEINVHSSNEIDLDNQPQSYTNQQYIYENQPPCYNVHSANEIDLDNQPQNYINQQQNYENRTSYYINQSSIESNSYYLPQDSGLSKAEHLHLQG